MKKMNNQKQQGFTLIELVIVIVILGILAATAAPKFINLTGDAKKAVMQGVQGSINSAVAMTHSKALIAAQTGATGEIKIGSLYYALVNGYPAAKAAGAGDGTTGAGLGIKSLLELGADITVTNPNNSYAYFQHSKATTPNNCRIRYINAANNLTPPVLTPTFTGC